MSERETSDTSLSRFFSVRPTVRVLPASECVCLVPRSFLLAGLSLTVRSEKSHLFHYMKRAQNNEKSRSIHSPFFLPLVRRSCTPQDLSCTARLRRRAMHGVMPPSLPERSVPPPCQPARQARVPASPSTSGAGLVYMQTAQAGVRHRPPPRRARNQPPEDEGEEDVRLTVRRRYRPKRYWVVYVGHRAPAGRNGRADAVRTAWRGANPHRLK
jgi:hypothetical protein